MTDTKTTPSQRLPALPLGGGFDLLAGVRVLDLTTSIAGPYCTLLLGDMGAEVVKIERPGQGDDCRAWGPPFIDGESVWFQSVNRNKQSVTLDYSQPDGLAILHELVAKSDIVVTNAVPRVQQKLKADYDTCRAIRPDVIFVSITGFGLSGARKDWPGYDLIAEGYSGVMDMTGEIENDPQKVGTPAADLLTGMDGAYAAVAALFDRLRTGRGHKLDLSLVESMTRFMTPIIAPHLATGEVPRRSGAKESVIAVYQVFHTADDPLTLGLGNDNLFKRFCNAVGRADMADNPDYANNIKRRANRKRLIDEIQAILKQKPRADWLALMEENKVPAGPIQRIDEVGADPNLVERGFLYRIDQDGLPPIPQINTGIQVDGKANAPRIAPPRLGAHTDAVLKSLLGRSDTEIAALRAAGIV